MNEAEIQEFCQQVYSKVYNAERLRLEREYLEDSRKNKIPKTHLQSIETESQKEAIKTATIEGMKQFPKVEAALIWHYVYESHLYRKCGISDPEVVSNIISADQSWKKSSGHAFEEMIKLLGSMALRNKGIEILLQRDLHTLIKAKELNNEPRDISWLKDQIEASIFDLYTVIHTPEGKQFCYGCIQSKTSIRDRVTRDREPSMQAMESYFWSTIIVLDGDFLKNKKFISMVNGGTPEHVENGWHGLYVFSEKYTKDRIYPIDLDFKNFKEHAVIAADSWLHQRQWFKGDWRADTLVK